MQSSYSEKIQNSIMNKGDHDIHINIPLFIIFSRPVVLQLLLHTETCYMALMNQIHHWVKRNPSSLI